MSTLTIDTAESVNATAPHSRVSKRYKLIPTREIVDRMAEHGWEPKTIKEVKASQVNRGYQKHIIRFANDKFDGGTKAGLRESRPEILLINSHMGTSSFRFMLGLFELVCENGLVIARENFGYWKFSHKGSVNARIDDAINTSLEQFPAIYARREQMMNITLKPIQQYHFAREAIKIRFQESKYKIEPKTLLTVRHEEQNTNRLWDVFNRVQENLIRGGFRAETTGAKKSRTDRRVRPIQDIGLDVKINAGLWRLAEKYAAKAGLN